jgi:hypothetical protein
MGGASGYGFMPAAAAACEWLDDCEGRHIVAGVTVAALGFQLVSAR